MTLSQSFTAKLFGAVAAAAMVFTLLAPAVQAQDSDLQAQIDALLAQIAELEAQLGDGGSSMSGSCSMTFTTPLSMGDSGPEVMKLQQFLNMDAETRVAATGVGSAGMETDYFGSLTKAAVEKFQIKYRADVLTPLGLANATGYWGNSSIQKANEVCAGMEDEDGTEDEDDDEMSGDLSGGEASLEDFDGQDGEDTDLREGQEEAGVADYEFDVEDGDVEVNRIDVGFAPASGNNAAADDDPWDVFESVAISVDGDIIAEEDVDSKSDWMDDSPEDGQHTIRFTGLDWVVEEGDTAEFTVHVTVQNSVDDASNEPTWYVFIPNDGIRAVDGVGIQNYIGEASSQSTVTSYADEVDFTIDEEGGDDELKLQSSSNDPDATVLAVKESAKSDRYTVFAFDLDTDDSNNDIVVETAVVGVQTGTANYEDVVRDAQLEIDGEIYDDVTVTDGDSTNATLTFDIDDELTIDAGDEVTAELQIEFKQQSGNYAEGETVTATTTSTGWAADGADDLTVATNLTGSATGETHTLRTQGVTLEFNSSTETYIENSDASTTDNEGEFTLKFDVTAFETDVWINKTAASGTTATTSGVMFQIEDNNGDAVADGSTNAVLTSSATEVGSEFRVNQGATETFTLKVTYDPAGSNTGFYQLQLYGVNFDVSEAADAETQQRALPAADYETDPLDI